MKRIAILAALPGELKPLVQRKNWHKAEVEKPGIEKWILRRYEIEWIAVCAGMGAEAATRAFAEAEAEGKLDGVLSIGWAGGLREEMHRGKFCIPNLVIDAQTGERFLLAERNKDSVLVTTAYIADAKEKRRLAETYGGSIVDMESATVVRLAEMRDIPVCCMKVVTDEAGARLPEMNAFIDSMGQMQTGKFVCYSALRPQYWPALARLGTASSKAAETLAGAVYNFISDETRSFRAVNKKGKIEDGEK
jgi:adenosylhomocysteine nucleosidase